LGYPFPIIAAKEASNPAGLKYASLAAQLIYRHYWTII